MLSAICYGLNGAPAREAAAHGVAGHNLTVVRNVVLFLGVGLWAALTRTSLRAPRADWPALAGLGLASVGTGVGYMTALGFVPVGVAVMVFYTYPVIVALATPFVDGKRLSGAAILAFAMALAGVALAVAASPEGLDWRGVALAGIASLSAAVQMFCASRAPGGGGLATVFWAQAIMIPFGLVLLAIFGAASLDAWTRAALPAAMSMGLYVGAYALQMRGMRRTSAAASSVIYCLEPVVAMSFAALWLGERLSGAQYLGAALVVAGIALELATRRKEASPAPAPEGASA